VSRIMEEFKSAINWFEIPVTDFDRAVRQGKTQISPEIGCFAIIDDTEGNRVYLHSMK